jgi:hypothetical protein
LHLSPRHAALRLNYETRHVCSALGHGGDVIKVFKNGAYSVRLDSSDDNFLFPLDVGPTKMPVQF